MTELLAVLTALFVIYVLYEVCTTATRSCDDANKAQPEAAPPTDPIPTPEPAATVVEEAPIAASAEPQAPAEAPSVEAEPAPIEEPVATPAPVSASPSVQTKVTTLRNPETGETSPAPSSYRFAKKWIKDAMVAEGLLKKAYKNSELTETVNTQAKEALEQFKKLTKYHV